jgi:hypothetical protein
VATRNPSELVKRKLRFEKVILEGAARMLWVMAYADFVSANARCYFCEEAITREEEGGTWVDATGGDVCVANDDNDHEPDNDFLPRPRSGEDWAEIATTPHGAQEKETVTPAVAFACARAFLQATALRENMTIADLFELAMSVHQGEPFEWYEDGDEDSAGKRKKLERKFEEAEDFGAGIAAQTLGHGFGWGDDHRTRHKGAVFEPRLPRVELTITGFDDAMWSVEGGGRGSDSIDRHISIAGDVLMEGDHDERRIDDEEIAIEALTHVGAVSEAVDALTDAGGFSMEPVVVRRDPDRFRAFYRSKDRAPGRVITFHLSGFFPIEREWVHYLYTATIGDTNYSTSTRKITIVNPDQYGSVDSWNESVEEQTGDPSTPQNVLFWFGASGTTYLLYFGDSVQDGLDECVDWIEEWAPGHLVDVGARYNKLLREALEERSLPDESLLGERDLEAIREAAEADTTQAGNHGVYLDSSEWGVVGENLTIQQLRQIGYGDDALQRNPPSVIESPTVNPSHAARLRERARATVIPFKTRTSAASRSRR